MTTAGQLAIARLGAFQALDGRRFDFTPEMFSDLVDSYDPQLRAAPLVVGHPKLDDPAYGWTKALSFDGKRLNAEPHQVDAAFAEGVNAGRYPNVSMAVYLPTSPGNPKPGRHYLKHIGFLGAAPPAVSGLPPAKLDAAHFAANDGAVEFGLPISHLGHMIADLFQRLRDNLIEREGAEKADAIIPQWQIRSISEATAEPQPVNAAFAAAGGTSPETDMDPAEFAARENALATRETTLATREAELATREQSLRAQAAATLRTSVAEFAAGLVKAGKLLPAQKDAVVEVLVSLHDAQPLEFAEAGAQVKKTPSDILTGLLNALPVRLNVIEKSGADVVPGAAEFAAPPGLTADPVGLDLHIRARAYQREHPNTPYLDAVRAVGG